MDIDDKFGGLVSSLSARRAWIEISIMLTKIVIGWSLSARRAWIEIHCPGRTHNACQWSLSARRAWIEITGRSVEFHLFASLSARRAWIEISVIA